MNADSAPATVTIEITRGSDVVTLALAAIAAFTASNITPPAILPGDVVKAKVTTAPVVAGAVVLWLAYQPLPIAA